MEAKAQAPLRRSLDRARHRKPLRVKITRRLAATRADAQEFVTQVRFPGGEAVVLPWDLERHAQLG